MKKVMLTLVLLFSSLSLIYAQDTIPINITDVPANGMDVCTNHVLAIYAETNCSEWLWKVNNVSHGMENPLVLQSQVSNNFRIQYFGCNFTHDCHIHFWEVVPLTSFTCSMWKRSGEIITIEPVGSDSLTWYNYIWSTGETTPTIDVIEAGIYTCEFSDIYSCATATRTFIVQDNVEISLATCDLETNHNMVTWPVTAAQAQYIDHLRIIRDGMEVGTANYSDGFFLDAIGSDAASRTYTLIAVATDGTECPIVSYPKETIHMAYLTGINNTIEVNWNVPTGYDLLGYNICEWHPGNKDGDLTIIDYVGAGVTSYTCSESMFDQGNVVIQGVEAGKSESRLLSNRSWETVGLNEQQGKTFKLYPNPSSGTFTVEGATTLTIYNTLGQIITTSHSENGRHSFSLTPGFYFVKSDEGSVQKVVVQ